MMTSIGRLFLAVLSLAGCSVLAHGGLNNYTVNNVWYRGYDPNEPAEEQDGQPWLVQRKWTTIDPVFDRLDKSLACNTPGSAAPSYIDIEAGQNISALYYFWLHPVGPMSVWLASCGISCETVDVNELDWFKIWHAGIVDDAEFGLAESTWYQKAFQKWDGTPAEWPVTIPSTLRPGKYLIRHEIISIHIAGKPQFYPECANLNITSRGTSFPPPALYKKIPGVYEMDDASLNIDIYSEESRRTFTYMPPGGPVRDGQDGRTAAVL